MKTCSSIWLLGVATSLLVSVGAASATLSVGDPAPKLQTGKWIQGAPLTGFDTNHVYIVEFWATWCGPCRESIPHLNELYEKYKDQGLIAIGQDAFEPNEDGVPAFVKKMGDKMTYRVALDDKSTDKKGAMARLASSVLRSVQPDSIPPVIPTCRRHCGRCAPSPIAGDGAFSPMC